MAKLMVITSRYTGRGHMSITEALNEQFDKLGGITADVVDGFALLGSQGPYFSKFYNTVTRHAPKLWEKSFKMSSKSELIPDTVGYFLRRRFEHYIDECRPDAIVTVHPFFVGTVLDEMERIGLNIPFVCIVADPINVHPLWCDARATLTICATEEAKRAAMDFGVPEERITVTGFPTRQAFVDAARSASERQPDPQRLSCLMLGGGGGAGEMEDFATTLLENTPHSLTVVCGSNEKLRERLVESLSDRFYGRVNVKGFVSEMEKEYIASDVALLRASPNCLFEAIVTAVPIIITGALPGQEQDNPKLCTENGFGVVCDSSYLIGNCLDELTANGCSRLKEMRSAAKAYRKLDSAYAAAKRIHEIVNKQ